MKEIQHKNFSIEINLKGSQKETLEIEQKETTDGIPFYECLVDNQKIQLRKDEKWELIWGELSPETVEELGAAIENSAKT